MHFLLETLFNTIKSSEGETEENCTTLKIVLAGLAELEDYHTTLVAKVLRKLQFEPLTKNPKRGLPTLNSPEQAGETALIIAAKNGSFRFVSILLAAGANPDLRANNGYTALMWALYYNHRHCVHALLAARADPNVADNAGRTAIWHALFAEDEAYLKTLIQHGASLELPNNEGLTLLAEAIKRGKLAALSLALAYGCLIRRQHVAALDSFIAKKSLALLYTLPTQNLRTSLQQLQFCQGVLLEYKGKEGEADLAYHRAAGFAPASRRRGDLCKKKGHFLMAARHYHEATQSGDFFAPGRLARLLKTHETLMPDKIANPAYFRLSVTFLRKAVGLIPLEAPLSSQKWRSIALHSLANEDWNPLMRLQKTQGFLEAAKKTARSALDKKETKQLWLSTNNLFNRMKARVQEPTDLIMEYSEQRALKVRNEVVETFLKCRG
jgi:hypothetical protein